MVQIHLRPQKKTNNNGNYETKTGLSQDAHQVMGADNRIKILIALMAQLVEQPAFNRWGTVMSL